MLSVIRLLCVGSLFCLFSCSKSTPENGTSTIPRQLVFSGKGFTDQGAYPKLYTCDSLGISPGLQWSKAPAGTQSYAITMHHYPPTYPTEPKHVYYVVYNIPSSVASLEENNTSVGSFGINTVDRKNKYTPPCSQGPGAKTYYLTLYALNSQPVISVPASQVTMDVLLTSIRGKIADSIMIAVTYTR